MTTLHYLPIYGRGELIRYILYHTETPFTDHRILHAEWWQLKFSNFSPSGQLPVLEIDGHTLTSSIACATYLSGKTGIFP